MSKNPSRDPRVDRYIREAAPFAQPILKQIRRSVHRHCPRAEETIKWNVPFFLFDGKILCVMAAFKAHCNFGFWKGRQIFNADGRRANVGMGQLGRITSVKQLPSAKALASYIKQAIELNAKTAQVKVSAPRKTKAPLTIPSYFTHVLRANKKAKSYFEKFSPGKKRDYIEWLMEAKTETTRERRLETAIEWISVGKDRHWKYRK